MAITAGRNPGNMTWFIDKDGDVSRAKIARGRN